jgi:hypothetical protein
MGFEAFRVELRGGSATNREANEAVRALPNVHTDPHSVPIHGSTYYLAADEEHVVEIELIDSPVRLSCRFTLCHPPSVDSFFLGVVQDLLARLGMHAKICDDVRPEHARSFSLTDYPEFAAAASHYIAARRAEWIAAFGDETLAATTNDVYQRIILPRCQPGIEQPT